MKYRQITLLIQPMQVFQRRMQPEKAVEVEHAVIAARLSHRQLAAYALIGRIGIGRHGGEAIQPAPQQYENKAPVGGQGGKGQAGHTHGRERHGAGTALKQGATGNQAVFLAIMIIASSRIMRIYFGTGMIIVICPHNPLLSPLKFRCRQDHGQPLNPIRCPRDPEQGIGIGHRPDGCRHKAVGIEACGQGGSDIAGRLHPPHQ